MYSVSDSINISNSAGGWISEDLNSLWIFSAAAVGFISFHIINYIQNQSHPAIATNEETQVGQYLNLLNRKKEILTQINDYEDCQNQLAKKQFTSIFCLEELNNITKLDAALSEFYVQLTELNDALQTELDHETIMPEHDLDIISEALLGIELLQKENEHLQLTNTDIRKAQEIKIADMEIKSKELRERMANTFFNNPTSLNSNLDSDKKELKL